MSKHYRPWKIDETQLLPARVQEYVPKEHPSRFIVALVREHLDLSEIEARYNSHLGQPPFHPALMTALLLNGYASGTFSSRRIAKACSERADCMMIVAGDAPDFRTISDFRKRHLQALKQLFVQVLKLCEAAGLAKLGHVAFDGSKIKANASKHKAMSYGRMEARASELEAEVDTWLAAVEAADAAEDELHGKDRRGDELPAWVADKKRRAAKIRAAQAELEAEAKAAAEEERRRRAEAEEKRIAEGRKKNGFAPKPPSDEPDGKTQRNFTDPESRIMKSKDGFVQAYNGQLAVDAQAQVIVAHDVTQSAVDSGQLLGMADAVEANLGRKPEQASADAGYCSEANLAGLEERAIDGYVATGRAPAGPGRPLPTRPRRRLHRPMPPPRRALRNRARRRRGSRPCAQRSGRAVTPAPTGCASRWSSRYSGRSSRPAASASSCCEASRRCAANGHWSAPPTTC